MLKKMMQSIPSPAPPEVEPRLPLELCEQIISYLWDDTKGLSSCSLTCRNFVARSQGLLYETVTIRNQSRLRRLAATLEDSLRLVRHIRHLELLFYPDSQIQRPGMDRETPLSRLHQIFLFCGKVTHLLLFPEGNRGGGEDVVECIRSFVHLPTLYHLDLHSFNGFSIQESLIGSNIKSLKISQTYASGFDNTARPVSNAYDHSRHSPIYLETLIMLDITHDMRFLSRMMSSRISSWLKLDRLRRLRISISTSNEMDNLNILFGKIHNTLTDIHLQAVHGQPLQWEHDHRIDISTLIYLEHLVLSCFVTTDNKAVPWLLNLLQQCNMMKAIKTLTINLRTINVESLFEEFADNTEWKTLDECLGSDELNHIQTMQITMFDDPLETKGKPPDAESERFIELCGILEGCLSTTISSGRLTRIEVIKFPFENGYYWPGRLNDDMPLSFT